MSAPRPADADRPPLQSRKGAKPHSLESDMALQPGFHALWPTPLGVHRYAQADALNPLLVRIFGALRATQGHARGVAPGAAFFARDDDLLHDFRVNAMGAAQAIRAALPALKAAEQASVVLFSSVAAGHGFASHASIAMAKGAVEALTRSMAAELAPKVRVNWVAPSLTRTPLSAPLLATEQMSALLAQLHPLQRLGEIDDIVSAAAFLLSDKAGWMTGQVIAVDGGRSTLASRK